MKNVSLTSGIFFLLAGLYLFNNPFAAVGTIAWIVALFIFISGISSLQYYLSQPSGYRPLLLLIQSLVSIFLGLSLMASSAFSRSNLVMLFVSSWLIILGFVRFFGKGQSYTTNHVQNNGLVLIGIGLLLFLAPVFSSVFIGKFLSLIFIMIGASALLFAIRQ